MSDERIEAERPQLPLPGLREIAAHAAGHNFGNGLAAFLFAATGPGALILAVSMAGGLSQAEITSWLLAAYGFSGVLTIVVSLLYRQPFAMGYSMPGVVLVGPALAHFSMAELIGAYLVTGLLILFLAATGLVRRVTAALPMPIVMAMVAGVFLPFGLRLLNAFDEAFWVALSMCAAYLLSSGIAPLQRILPPIFAALAAGVATVMLTTGFSPTGPITLQFAEPVFRAPVFSIEALLELVLPLTVTVVGIHNIQGFAILRNAGYRPPERMITYLCGGGTLAYALLGSVPTVVTGPANAILNASGPVAYRYVGGLWFGLFFILFGIFAPVAVAVGLAVPKAFILVMAGLAMLPVLQSAFVAAFKGPFALGALVTFLVTVAGVSIFNIGAAFWGLVFGYIVSRLAERGDFKALAAGDD